jgi:hypothetical protein
MNSSKAAFAALALLAMVTVITRADEKDISVAGTWRLVSLQSETSDGKVTDLYGSPPLGQLIYDASGHMSVHLLKPDLPKCGSLDRRVCPDRQARSAFDNYLGYWGRYRIDQKRGTVTHIVDGASVPDWVGTSQERFFKLSGNRLTLTTPPQKIGGMDSVQRLVWVRE